MSDGSGNVYGFTVAALSGAPVDLSQYRGKLLLIVNTASKCGFTSQYGGLEQLYRQYHERGLEVLAFPCNQFGGQEPGDAAEIGTFCEGNYGVSFPLFAKIDVNGARAEPLFQYLKQSAPGLLGKPIRWNFTKFLVRKDGSVYRRYAPLTKPKRIARDIEKILAA